MKTSVALALGLTVAVGCGGEDPPGVAALSAPQSAAPDCEQFERWPGSGIPTVFVRVARLNLREAPSTDAKIVAKLSRGLAMVVRQKCDDWIEVDTDLAVSGRIESFTGWVHHPLTCTTSDEIRGAEYSKRHIPRAARPVIAPECPTEVESRAQYLAEHPYEN